MSTERYHTELQKLLGKVVREALNEIEIDWDQAQEFVDLEGISRKADAEFGVADGTLVCVGYSRDADEHERALQGPKRSLNEHLIETIDFELDCGTDESIIRGIIEEYKAAALLSIDLAERWLSQNQALKVSVKGGRNETI